MGKINIKGFGTVDIAGDKPTPEEAKALYSPFRYFVQHVPNMSDISLKTANAVQPVAGGIQSMVDAAAQGSTLGLGDPVYAAGKTLLYDPLTTGQRPSLDQFFKNVNDMKDWQSQSAARSPKMYAIGSVLGQVANALLMGPVSKGAQIAYNVGSGALRGALDSPDIDIRDSHAARDVGANAAMGALANTAGSELVGRAVSNPWIRDALYGGAGYALGGLSGAGAGVAGAALDLASRYIPGVSKITNSIPAAIGYGFGLPNQMIRYGEGALGTAAFDAAASRGWDTAASGALSLATKPWLQAGAAQAQRDLLQHYGLMTGPFNPVVSGADFSGADPSGADPDRVMTPK